MNLFQELLQRRVPQITSGYAVGGWGLLQALTFLESRMAISPHLVNLIGLALVLFLPSVITLAWIHGRPGKDTWGRAPKIVLPANLLAAGLVLFIVFNGRDLGAVTQTIAVADENGAVTEREVPKNEYRRRILVFYPEFSGPEEDALAGEALAFLLRMDLSQDVFLDPVLPLDRPNTMREAGSTDGHGLARPQQRKLARDAHLGYFLTGSLARQDGQWRLATELHESDTGKVVAQRTDLAEDMFSLVDHVSLQLREDLGIPAAHLDASVDLPIAEITSADPEAVASHVRAVVAVTHQNDWEGAVPHLEDAVDRDPNFAIAQFLLFAVLQTLGDAEGASAAIAAAMDNLYRVPERLSLMIKAQYYYNEKQDWDKALAVLNMWSQIYPDDVAAYDLQATFYYIRQDLPNALAAYEKILAIDPSRLNYLENLADVHTQLGNYDEAEGYLKRYVEVYPTRPEGYEDLSDFYSATGRLQEARDALAKAQLLEPEDQDLVLSLIDLDVKAGKYQESEQALSELLDEADTPRKRFRIYARQVILASLQGQSERIIDRAEAYHSAMLETQNPLQANLVYSLMLPAVSMAGRPEEALVRLTEIKTRIPDTFKGLVGVGEAWVLVDLGRLDEATSALAEAAEVVDAFGYETLRSSMALVEGLIAQAGGDLDAAISHYRKAIEIALMVQPEHRLKLARALRLAGDEKEAMDILEEGLKTEPTYPTFQLELAHLQFNRGDAAKARKHLDVALAAWVNASPEFPPAQEARQLEARLDTP